MPRGITPVLAENFPMKKKKDWVSTEDLYSMFDSLVGPGAQLDDLNGYSAATSLGLPANGRLYTAFGHWKSARKATAENATFPLPTELVTDFRQQLEAIQGQILTSFSDTCKAVGAEIQTRSRREVVAAEEALERQKNEVGHLVDQLCEVEQQRDEYKENVAKLSAQLGRAEKDRTKLQSRLEEAERFLQQLLARIPLTAEAEAPPADPDQTAGPLSTGSDINPTEEKLAPMLPLEAAEANALTGAASAKEAGDE